MKRFTAIIAAVLAVCVLLCACSGGGESKKSAKPLTDIWSSIKSEVSFSDFAEFTDAAKMKHYYGITEDMMDEFAGGVNSSGVNQEEIVLVKAKDESSAAQIKDKLDKRFDSKLNQNKNYNAEQAKMIEGCKVEQNGLYVTMIVSGNAGQITKIFKEQAAIE